MTRSLGEKIADMEGALRGIYEMVADAERRGKRLNKSQMIAVMACCALGLGIGPYAQNPHSAPERDE